MATSRRKKKKGGRKLEFTIYFVGILLVVLALLGLFKLAKNLFAPDDTKTGSSSVVADAGQSAVTDLSQPEHVSSVPEESTVSQSGKENSEPSSEAESQSASSEDGSSTASSESSEPPKQNGDYIHYTKSGAAELSEWYLLLVNPSHSISDDWITDMTDIGGQQLDSRIVEAYYDLVEAAANDGANLWCASGYRSYDTQSYLYANELDEVKGDYPDLNQSEAEAKAASVVARPGTSEHQTGLAIDFNYVEESFGSTTEGIWLKEHAHEYGFILRYEQDKQPLTQVIYEPWHYRFVGVKHATRIKELGFCLEEYVEYLQNGGK